MYKKQIKRMSNTTEMTDEEFKIFHDFMRFNMKYDIWYPVKSERQRELLEYMMQECIFDCEFNADATMISRVELNRYYNAEHNRNLTERTRTATDREQDVA